MGRSKGGWEVNSRAVYDEILIGVELRGHLRRPVKGKNSLKLQAPLACELAHRDYGHRIGAENLKGKYVKNLFTYPRQPGYVTHATSSSDC